MGQHDRTFPQLPNEADDRPPPAGKPAAIRPRSSVGGLTWAHGRFPFPLSTEYLSHLRHGGFPAAAHPCHDGHRPGKLSDGGKIVFRSHSTFAKSKTFLLLLR